MIGIDANPLVARLLTAFTALEAKLGADGVSAASIAAEKKQLEDTAKPLYEVRGKVMTLITAAKNLSFPGMTAEQEQHARAALAAAEALDTSTTTVMADSKSYSEAAQLCDTLLKLCVGVEKATKGYQSRYTWETPENRSYSSEQTVEQVQRVTALFRGTAAGRDTVVKRAVEAHRGELEAVRGAAAELALAEVVQKGFEFMLHGEHVKPAESIAWMLDRVKVAAPYVSDAVLETMLARFVQVATAVVYTSKSTVAAYAANPAKCYVDAEALRRLQGTFNALAAEPSKIGDPADLFVSESELKNLAGVEGGMSNPDAPARPNIPVAEVVEMAKAFATALVGYPAR